MKKLLITIFVWFIFLVLPTWGQVEHIPCFHPVYSFLLHCETKGILTNFSLSSLPLQKKEIINALKKIRSDSILLNYADIETLKRFEIEFNILKKENAVLFFSKTDTLQIISERFFSDNEKYIFHYYDSTTENTIVPLASLDNINYFPPKGNYDKVLMGNLGIRLNGTFDDVLGYYLQITNGMVLLGNKEIALKDRFIRNNVKFQELSSDFDFSESHIRLDLDWFYAFIGRENRLLGAGINQFVFQSDLAPPFDAISLGIRFKSFEYRYTHGSLIALNESCVPNGKDAIIPPKFLAMHRFAFKPSWGEIAFWENVIYSNRNPDLAYLIPLSFFKNIEHTLHDRDNTMLGVDMTLRPFPGIQLKGSFLMDDVMFSELGTGFWHNKFAWNLGIIYSLPFSIDIAIEYARVEPFTFSHFNNQNSMTNDSVLFGGYLLPNSDQFSVDLFWFYGKRYPLILKFSYYRHGDNIKDDKGNVIKNVGGDPLFTRRSEDPYYYTFLDGDRKDNLKLELFTGIELIRGFNLKVYTQLLKTNENFETQLRLILSFEDFFRF